MDAGVDGGRHRGTRVVCDRIAPSGCVQEPGSRGGDSGQTQDDRANRSHHLHADPFLLSGMGTVESNVVRIPSIPQAVGCAFHATFAVVGSCHDGVVGYFLPLAEPTTLLAGHLVARMSWLIVWVAQGFGTGRIPLAPGTFGTLVGVIWFLLLVRTGTIWGYVAGTLLGLLVSVAFCGWAEKILKQADPGSIVLDEIAAVPICFAPWVIGLWLRDGQWPPANTFWDGNAWIGMMIVVILFRIFDIAKPWPIRQSQSLPGGWGVTIDDLLASVYVAVLAGLIFLAF